MDYPHKLVGVELVEYVKSDSTMVVVRDVSGLNLCINCSKENFLSFVMLPILSIVCLLRYFMFSTS